MFTKIVTQVETLISSEALKTAYCVHMTKTMFNKCKKRR